MHILSSLLLGAGLIAGGVAFAADAPKAPAKDAVKTAPAAKPAAKKNAKAKAEEHASADDDDEDLKSIDLATAVVTEYNCELGAKVAFYHRPGNDHTVAVRWGKQLVSLKRIETTTGADRFESKRHGLVWIGIPAKALLLDSKKGQQLANGCRNAQQMQLAQPQS